MKKILAIIMAFLTSLSTSTDYNIASEKTYTDGYYTVKETALPDYRSYYGGGDKASLSSGCKTTKYNAHGEKIKGTSCFWFIDGESFDVNTTEVTVYDEKGIALKGKKYLHELIKVTSANSKYKDKYDASIPAGAFKNGKAIICPTEAKLVSSSKSTGLTSMTIACMSGNNRYKVKINNMQKWYCDADRKGDILFHTGDEQKGAAFHAGNVLGYATPETSIVIYPINAKNKRCGTCTMKQFYSGIFTKVKST